MLDSMPRLCRLVTPLTGLPGLASSLALFPTPESDRLAPTTPTSLALQDSVRSTTGYAFTSDQCLGVFALVGDLVTSRGVGRVLADWGGGAGRCTCPWLELLPWP